MHQKGHFVLGNRYAVRLLMLLDLFAIACWKSSLNWPASWSALTLSLVTGDNLSNGSFCMTSNPIELVDAKQFTCFVDFMDNIPVAV